MAVSNTARIFRLLRDSCRGPLCIAARERGSSSVVPPFPEEEPIPYPKLGMGGSCPIYNTEYEVASQGPEGLKGLEGTAGQTASNSHRNASSQGVNPHDDRWNKMDGVPAVHVHPCPCRPDLNATRLPLPTWDPEIPDLTGVHSAFLTRQPRLLLTTIWMSRSALSNRTASSQQS